MGKVGKVLEAAKDIHGKLGAAIAELDELLQGRAGIGTKLKAIELAFDQAWCSRYAGGTARRYVWNYVADRAQMKRLLQKLTAEEICDRALRFIKSEEPFYLKARHSFGLFVRSINEWALPGDAPADLELQQPTAADCKHTPTCRSDQEHTRRRNADMRAAR